MTKTVFITGATSGIGMATARAMAALGYKLILCGRRKERLENLEAELQGIASGIHLLCFDVRMQADVQKAVASLPEEFRQIDILINNAGNAHGLSSIDKGDLNDWDMMIDINVKGLLYVSAEIIPGMVERSSGHIVNIGSVAGKEVYPNGNVYCASKHAVDALTQGMRMDLYSHGIKVSAVNPGMVDTEFSLVRFKGDAERAARVYDGFKPLSAEDIADLIVFMVTRPAHVNIADVLIFPSAQAAPTLVKKS